MKMLVVLVLLISNVAMAKPKKCNPEKSKPCGNSCIIKEFKCHKK